MSQFDREIDRLTAEFAHAGWTRPRIEPMFHPLWDGFQFFRNAADTRNLAWVHVEPEGDLNAHLTLHLGGDDFLRAWAEAIRKWVEVDGFAVSAFDKDDQGDSNSPEAGNPENGTLGLQGYINDRLHFADNVMPYIPNVPRYTVTHSFGGVPQMVDVMRGGYAAAASLGPMLGRVAQTPEDTLENLLDRIRTLDEMITGGKGDDPVPPEMIPSEGFKGPPESLEKERMRFGAGEPRCLVHRAIYDQLPYLVSKSMRPNFKALAEGGFTIQRYRDMLDGYARMRQLIAAAMDPEEVRKVKTPVMIIIGEEDKLVSVKLAEQTVELLKEGNPNSRLVPLKDTGHNLLLTTQKTHDIAMGHMREFFQDATRDFTPDHSLTERKEQIRRFATPVFS